MKVFKHMTALVLALVMAAALAVTAYAATVTSNTGSSCIPVRSPSGSMITAKVHPRLSST